MFVVVKNRQCRGGKSGEQPPLRPARFKFAGAERVHHLPRPKKRTANFVWFPLAFLVLVVAFVFLYDPPTEPDDHSGASQKEGGRWEWAREDRVPQGAFWDPLWPANDCRAYGKREYWAALRNIPEDWTEMEACMNMPVEIKDVSVRRPDRCGYVDGSSHIIGFWIVDWDQVDCKPWHVDVTDQVSLG